MLYYAKKRKKKLSIIVCILSFFRFYPTDFCIINKCYSGCWWNPLPNLLFHPSSRLEKRVLRNWSDKNLLGELVVPRQTQGLKWKRKCRSGSFNKGWWFFHKDKKNIKKYVWTFIFTTFVYKNSKLISNNTFPQ